MKEKIAGTNPLVQTGGPQDAAAMKKAEEEESKALQVESEPQLEMLEAYLKDIYDDARSFKESETSIQQTMIDCLQRRNGEYSQQKLNDIKAVDSAATYLPLTGVKCRAIEAFIRDIYMNAKRKRTWILRPTPISTIPEKKRRQIMQKSLNASRENQEMTPQDTYKMASQMRADLIAADYKKAKECSEKMSRKVDDQLIEGGFVKALAEGIMDISTFPAMIIKGPILRKRRVRTGWKKGKIQYDSKVVPTFERVSPLDIYPSRYSCDVNDGTPLCEKITLSRSSLVMNRDEKGYHKENIEYVAVYASAGENDPSDLESDREDAEKRDSKSAPATHGKKHIGSTLEGIEYWCSVRGRDLIDFGITKGPDGKKIDIFLDYEINAITVDCRIVYIDFNTDPLNRRPYSVTGFSKEIGGFWYKPVPMVLKDIQDVVNAAARALVNNLAWSSGPQVIIPDINRLAPGEDITNIYVGKIWQGVNAGAAGAAKLVDFYQPDSRSSELISIINQFVALADQLIEMPSYTMGNDKVSGAGRTSSGLSMLMSSSNRGMKRMIMDMDRNIIENIVTIMTDANLDDPDIPDDMKGDMNFYSEGVIGLMMKEQLSERQMSLLQATNNEFDMKIIGLDGRAKILARAIESLEDDYDDIVPTEEKIERLLQQEETLQQQQIEQNQMNIEKERQLIEREAEVKSAEIEISLQELDLKRREQDLQNMQMQRELDIRAEKQTSARIDSLQKMDIERQKAGIAQSGQEQGETTDEEAG